MYTLYSLVTAVGMFLLSPYFLVRGLINGKYLDHIADRMGWRFPPELTASCTKDKSDTIWIHAVSVGEVLAVLPLARRIQARYPARRLVISTTTKTGQILARERKGIADAIFYFPLDWNGPVRRAFQAVKPSAVIIVETEIWPNFLHRMRAASVPVIFVNGRVSEKSFRGYQRAFTFSANVLRNLMRRILSDATLFLMQSDRDASRLLDLGANPASVIVTGNLKYDIGIASPTPFSSWLPEFLERSQRKPIIVAGSVLTGEEEPVLKAFAEVRKHFPNAFLILAPRKPERFDAAFQIVKDAGETPVRRTSIDCSAQNATGFDQSCTVLLLDSVGELASIYAHADAVFVGGSLVPLGGHNILEPAAFAKVPVFGPSMENFRDIAKSFLEAGAAVQVNNAASLASAWIDILQSPEKSSRMGIAARAQVEKNCGATDNAMRRLAPILDAPRSTP